MKNKKSTKVTGLASKKKLIENVNGTKGITLIALVVTIIILLILAGVAINISVRR